MNISIMGKEIPLYGLFFFLGIGVAIAVALFFVKKKRLEFFDFVCAAIYAMIGAMIGAKLLFLLVSWKEIVRLKLSLLEIVRGGFVFYGGLLGGCVGLFFYGKQFKSDVGEYMDIFATVLPLGHAFGRVGCFYAGCCYGIPYDGIGCIRYEKVNSIFTPIGIGLFPVQLVEAVCLLLLFISLSVIFFKTREKGRTATVYLGAYAVLRFVLEFFRGDVERGLVLGLSTSQWVSLLLLCTVVLVVIRKRIANEKDKSV